MKKPQLHWSPLTFATYYVISEPPTIFYYTKKTLSKGYPSIVWQQQMKTAYVERYNEMHLVEKETPLQQTTVKQNISTPFRALPQIQDYKSQFIERQYQQDPFWDDDLYDHEKT